MTYLVIGAGGTGGAIAAFLKKAGKDVTLLARGNNLKVIKENGLTLKKKDSSFNVKVNVTDDCWDKKDVIFVCVKGYSLDEVMPYIKRASHENTVIIPILNIYGTGEKINEQIFMGQALNGCVYITAEKEENGVIYMSGDIFRIVFGNVNGNVEDERYKAIEKDLNESGIRGILSADIKRDTFKKFSFISPMAAAGAYLDAEAGRFKKVGFAQTLFINCIDEICALAKAMGIELPEDMREKNIALMNAVDDKYISSMHKDVRAGGQTEMDGLIFNVVRLAKEYKIKVPTYEKISEHFGFRVGCDCENRVEISGEVC